MPESNCIERFVGDYKNLSDRFVVKRGETDFKRQYFTAYSARFQASHRRLLESARAKWPGVPVVDLSHLKEGQECLVVGIIVKNHALRPTVLKELAEEINELPQPVQGLFTQKEDTVDLEDLNQRIQLKENLNVQQLVTGIPVAVYGKQVDSDFLQVIHMDFIPKPNPRPIISFTDDKYVLIICGLNFTGRDGVDGSMLLAAQLLSDWLMGSVGLGQSDSLAPKICRLIVAGNLISNTAQDKSFSKQARYLTRKHISPSVECVRNVDRFLSAMAPVIAMDVMPGANDPTTHMLPQQPLHKCIFPRSAAYNTFNLVTNPYKFEIDNRVFLGSSGQNVDDIKRYSVNNEGVNCMERVFEWQHICPTTPDTLDGYPFAEGDPFLMQEPLPDIVFAGNQPEFQYKMMKHEQRQHLLVNVPPFSDTGLAVCVGLSNLNVQPIVFGTKMDSDFE